MTKIRSQLFDRFDKFVQPGNGLVWIIAIALGAEISILGCAHAAQATSSPAGESLSVKLGADIRNGNLQQVAYFIMPPPRDIQRVVAGHGRIAEQPLRMLIANVDQELAQGAQRTAFRNSAVRLTAKESDSNKKKEES